MPAPVPNILFRDERFLVLDKPAGLPVHPGPRGGPSIEDCFPLLPGRRKEGPWLAHRLDADTAGCLLIALRRASLRAAQAEFAAGRVRKTYWAIVIGVPSGTQGRIKLALARQTSRTGWRMIVDRAGQTATTDWCLRGTTGEISWLELSPRTGRTHQVRVHCAALGCPVLGDPVYGSADGPMQLLARALALGLDPPVAATAPPPPHMERALSLCGFPPGLSGQEPKAEQ